MLQLLYSNILLIADYLFETLSMLTAFNSTLEVELNEEKLEVHS